MPNLEIVSAVAICLLAFTPLSEAAPPKASSSGLLVVANKGDRALGIIDPAAGKQVAEVPEDGVTGHEVAVSPDGRTAYVPIYGNSGVGKAGTDGRKMVVIDLKTRKITGTVDFGHGVRPHCPVFGPKNGLLYARPSWTTR